MLDEGETARFTATIRGVSETNYFVWRKRGNGTLVDKALGVNETELIIPHLNTSDEGEYYCTVTNEWDRSMESSTIILMIKGNVIQTCCSMLSCN